jgi:alkyldihydroxyacetonephosphate synthase
MNNNNHERERINRRLLILSNHLNNHENMRFHQINQEPCAIVSAAHLKQTKELKSSVAVTHPPGLGANIPNQRQRLIKWNGWGYKDTEFLMDENLDCLVSGNRYILSGKFVPMFRPWIERFCGVDVKYESPAQTFEQMEKKISKPIVYEPFLDALKQAGNPYKYLTFDNETRLLHGHGHSGQEIFQLRYGHFNRLPDVVIYPGEHAHVEKLVKIANEYADHVTMIPYGGGTTVSQALMVPENERRMVISLDMQEMNRILKIDYDSNLAWIEAGAIGVDIQEKLAKEGLTLGHEPDSYEFSSLGGWVATRASGMKKNLYGNIEDMIVNIKFVTPKGTILLGCDVPRKSTGPDINNIIIGSEGTIGVVTECCLRIRKLPQAQIYGSIVFPDFESGVACMHEIASRRCAPASIRLIDNSQFQFGQSLKVKDDSSINALGDWFKKVYVTKICGFNPDTMCVMSLLFEGNEDDVANQQKLIYSIAAKYGGIKAGADNGIRAYLLTYVIAYLRDYGLQFYFMAESFETSIPWSKVLPLINNVKQRIYDSAKMRGVPGQPWVSARVTQTYDTGAAVYFYFGFIFRGLKDPIRIFSEVESDARDEILANGGSLSHHHGVGKLRMNWMEKAVSETGINLLKGIKKHMDPNNVFGCGNMNLQDERPIISVDHVA